MSKINQSINEPQDVVRGACKQLKFERQRHWLRLVAEESEIRNDFKN